MCHLLKRLSLAMGLFTPLFSSLSASAELVQLPEASGPQGYVVVFTGHCAERVGLKVMSGRRKKAVGIPELVQHAEQSVEYVLAICPQVQDIVGDVRISQNPMAAMYFTMSRAGGWKVEKQIRSGELHSLLEGAGYQTFAGPRPIYSKGYWRLDNGRLDAVYGNDLENRMVATHVERYGSDDYRVRGQIYDLGYNQSGIACESSRKGYALWGSVTLTVSAKLSAIPIAIKWCAEASDNSKTVDSEFFELPWYGSASTKPDSTAQVLSAAFGTMPGVIDVSATTGLREPLIDRELYQVYATTGDFCSDFEFDLVYRVNHQRRASLFNGKFDQSVSNIVGTLAGRRCGEAKRFAVNNYSAGDPERWDRVEYEYISNAGSNIEIPYRVSRRIKSTRAQASNQKTMDLQFGTCEGPFCELPGGRYLNAIYSGDLVVVRQIDGLHQAALNRVVQGQKARLGGGVLAQAYDSLFDPTTQQMLMQVANKYMHAYEMWGDSCFDPGADTKRYSYTTPVVIETDEYGTTTSGGETFETTYTLNAEFFPLRDQLATYKGAKRSDDPANLEVKGSIFKGIVELTQTGDCRSPEVKQLEKQLRAMTSEVQRNPGALPPTDAVRPPRIEQIVAPGFAPISSASGLEVAWNAPVPLPEFAGAETAGAGATGSAQPRLMNQQERMEKANQEMIAAQTKYQDELAAVQLRAAQAAKAGRSQAEMMKMMQEGQAEMMRLQQEFQQEMARIRQKYM